MMTGLRPRGGAEGTGGAAEALRAVHAQEAGGAPGRMAPAPLAEVEAALAGLSDLPRTELSAPGRPLASGVCVQFQGDAGVQARIEGLAPAARRGPAALAQGMFAPALPPGGGGPTGGFRLALDSRGDSPWFSLEIALPAAPLAAARALCLRIAGRSETGVVSLRPTLRLGFGDGWTDTRFPADIAFTPIPSRQLLALPLDECPNREAAAPVLILFLRQSAAALTLEQVELMLGA